MEIEQREKPKTLYFAAALFCLREIGLNAVLNDKLLKLGYKTNFPQRDGFEFSQFTNDLFDKHFKDDDHKKYVYKKSQAISYIIYLLDLGKFLYESDVCIANLDEPLDPGVIVEVMFAHQMNKPVVGYRTESRSPYGELDDFSNGMHFFLLFPCDSYLMVPQTSISNSLELDKFAELVAQDLDKAVVEA